MSRRFPRALVAVLVGLGLLSLAGAGTVWAHYRSTPTFREWARAKPVDEALWRRHVPLGAELGRGATWRSDDGPARERFGQWRTRFTAQHGDEVLLDLEVEVRVESREVEDSLARGGPSEAFEGLEVFVVDRGHDPDFHGVAVLTLRETARPQGPELQLDVFALAGAGDVELIVQDFRQEGSTGPGALLGGRPFAEPSPLGGLDVLAQMLSLEDPPSEGLAYQARMRLHLIWNWRNGQGSSAGFGDTYLAATSRLYSASLKVLEAVRSPFDPSDHFSISRTHALSRTYTWNDAVW